MDVIPGWSELSSALKMNDAQVIAWIVLGIISSILSTVIIGKVLKGLS